DFGSPVKLSGGSATSDPTAKLSVGDHTVTAEYSGDNNFSGSSGTWSQTISTPSAVLQTATAPPAIVRGATGNGTIRGTVFYDINADQQLDDSEPPINSVTVTLFLLSDAGKRQVPNNVTRNPFTTSADGIYRFDNLDDKDYLVEFPNEATFTQQG